VRDRPAITTRRSTQGRQGALQPVRLPQDRLGWARPRDIHGGRDRAGGAGFFAAKGGKLHHRRIDAELAKAAEISGKRRDARKQKPSKPAIKDEQTGDKTAANGEQTGDKTN
jgi:hypothetical protein